MTEQQIPAEYAWIKPGVRALANGGCKFRINGEPYLSRRVLSGGRWDVEITLENGMGGVIECRLLHEVNALTDLGEARLMIANLNRKVGDLEADNQRLTDALAAIRERLREGAKAAAALSDLPTPERIVSAHGDGADQFVYTTAYQAVSHAPDILALIAEIQALAGVREDG